MEEKDQRSNDFPGLPEALDPLMANGTAWENDAHLLALRSPDPLKNLDEYLLDEKHRAQIISKLSNPGFPSDVPDQSQVSEEVRKGKERGIQGHKESDLPDWMDNMSEEFLLREDPNKPKDLPEEEVTPIPIKPEGKRVKKAVKKARKQVEKATKSVEQKPASAPVDPTLSPFTSWLKALRGSEYVHPYEDDYALRNQAEDGKEGISETFADLLASQGYKDQAIDMYTRLMAKYPEKSSFFAAKIETLS